MGNCQRCLENNWEFIKLDDGNIQGICQFCGYEVEWTPKAKTKMRVGSLCKKCKTPVIKKQAKFKPSKLKKSYYYTAYYYCKNCKTMYMSEDFKIINNIKKRKAMRDIIERQDINTIDNNNLCPICKLVPSYTSTRIVKGGEERTIEWWACKKCSKITPIDEYVEKMIKDINNKKAIATKDTI